MTLTRKQYEAEIVRIFDAASLEVKRVDARLKWTFEPQKAVNLIFGEAEEYSHQRLIYTYLFLSWALAPGETEVKSPHQRPLAASVALRVFLTATDKKGGFLPGPLTDLGVIRKRFADPKFEKMYEGLVVPAKGLINSISAVNLSGQDRFRRIKYEKLRAQLAMIDYLAKAVRCGSTRLSRAWCYRAFSADVLCKGADFYTSRQGEKRLAAAAQRKDAGVARTMSETAFEDAWRAAPRTIILLYFLEALIGVQVKFLFSDSRVLQLLGDDLKFLNPLRQALINYQTVVNAFAKYAGPNTKAKTLWRPVTVPLDSPSASLPEFSPEQMERFEKLQP